MSGIAAVAFDNLEISKELETLRLYVVCSAPGNAEFLRTRVERAIPKIDTATYELWSGNHGGNMAFQLIINSQGEYAGRIYTRNGRVSRQSSFTKDGELSIILDETSGLAPNETATPFQLVLRTLNNTESNESTENNERIEDNENNEGNLNEGSF